MSKKFYCYALLDSSRPGNYNYGRKAKFSHEPFYIGKGHGARAEVHVREALQETGHSHKAARIRKILREGHQVMVKRTKSLSTESRAFAREKELIALIGRRQLGTGPLVNLTDGGEGSSGYVFTSKDRKLLELRCRERGLTTLVEFKGKNLTYREWSALTGISAHAIQCRLLNGWSVKDALTIKPKAKTDYSNITFKGTTRSLKEWSAEVGIKYVTLINRLEQGWSTDDTLTNPLGFRPKGTNRKDALVMSLHGVTKSLKAWSADYGISYSTVRSRFVRGLKPKAVLGIG